MMWKSHPGGFGVSGHQTKDETKHSQSQLLQLQHCRFILLTQGILAVVVSFGYSEE